MIWISQASFTSILVMGGIELSLIVLFANHPLDLDLGIAFYLTDKFNFATQSNRFLETRAFNNVWFDTIDGNDFEIGFKFHIHIHTISSMDHKKPFL